MQPISVVIICKNESAVIGETLQTLAGVTDDIIVYDNGSTDDTMEIATRLGAKVYSGEWKGFGQTKTIANALAKYDWILSLDADERIDEQLKRSLISFNPSGENEAYDLRFKNFLGNKLIRHGEWGGDHHVRLFNRKVINWNEAPVHEELNIGSNVRIKKLEGAVLHRTVKDMKDYARKTIHYAMLGADKYFERGKKSSWLNIRLSPLFNFINSYVLKLGFLDGKEGWICAKMTAYYTFLKYSRLKELWKKAEEKAA